MSTFASFDGTKLAYESYGSEDDRPPVLLLHGFAADSHANWVRPHVVEALVGARRRVLALDARGHGNSEKPHDPAAYADDAMVRDAQALLDELRIEVVDVCGYSMGAMTTYALAAREPRARSAVLGGVGAKLGGPALAKRAPLIADALLVEDPSTIQSRTAAAFRAFADSTGADRKALAAIQRSRRSAPLPEGASIRVPTLVIAGDRDVLVGSPDELAARIPGATAAVVSGDHLGAVYDPKFREEIVAFLERIDESAAAATQG
jgi:pimeloyl-ACP methyl ester carboxylesterase